MNIIREVHGYFNTLTKGFLVAIFEASDELLTSFRNQIIIKARIYAITTAVGDELDLWGSDLDVARLTGESDSDYRDRLKVALQGKGVTKEYLQDVVNSLLAFYGFTGEGTIYEWFDDTTLEKGWFKIDLPLESNTGFFCDYSYLDYVSTTRNRKECHLDDRDAPIRRLRLPDIRSLLNRWKASGIQYLVYVKGVLYE